MYTCRLYKELQDVAESQSHRLAEGGGVGGESRDERSGLGDGRTSSAAMAALQHQLATTAKVQCYRLAHVLTCSGWLRYTVHIVQYAHRGSVDFKHTLCTHVVVHCI